jgi:hypothetical protein
MQCLADGLPEDLSAEQREVAIGFISEHAHSSSRSEYDLGRTDLFEHSIDTGANRPFRQPFRRHPMAHLPVID